MNEHEPAVTALERVPVNTGFARAVLQGTGGGELWAADADPGDGTPRAWHAVHAYGMSFVWGGAVDEAFDDVAVHLRARAASGREEWLQVEPRWAGLPWDDVLGAVPLADAVPDGPQRAVRHVRVNFAFDPVRFAAARAERPLPTGVTTRPAVAADHAFPGAVVPAHFWPGAADFLAHGGGAVAEVDGTPAAIAFASFDTDGEIELGIETVPAFRRRGLAAHACAAMIDDLLAAGRTPVWSCREDNVGSFRLAEALGFVPTLRLPYWHVLAG